MANQRAENKTNAMFWVDGSRKAFFQLACKNRGLTMTQAFERFIDSIVVAALNDHETVTVDLTSDERHALPTQQTRNAARKLVRKVL